MNMFFSIENWESDIRDVQIEPCAAGEDPLGYRAVFVMMNSASKASDISFRVGASELRQRARSLAVAGFNAPMTKKAIAMIENKLSGPLNGLPA